MTNRMLGSAAMAFALMMPVAGWAASDLTDIRRQIDSLTQRRNEDDRRIRDLETRLRQAEEKAQRAVDQANRAAASAAAPSATKPAGAPMPGRAAAAGTPAVTPAGTPVAGPANAFNPGLNIVLDGKIGVFSRNPENFNIAGFSNSGEGSGERGFFLGEVELNAFANVDDWFFGSLTLAIEQGDDETELELEEAFLDTLFLPYGFQARAGKFFSGIGYLNSIHAHADDFVDRPLAYQTFLNGQYGDVGARLTWVAPTDIFLQLGAEAFRGVEYPAAGAEHRGFGTQSVFAKAGGDIGTEWSWQSGLSWLFTRAGDRDTNGDLFNGDTDVGIAHLIVKWAPDGNPRERNLKLQTELFRSHDDGDFNGIGFNRTDWGFYGQAIYQFAPQWRTGYRFDWLSAGGTRAAFNGTSLDNSGHDPTRHSAMVEYNRSEFSRLRLQYNYDRSRADRNDHQLLLQYTATLGVHPAHGF